MEPDAIPPTVYIVATLNSKNDIEIICSFECEKTAWECAADYGGLVYDSDYWTKEILEE